MDVTVTIPDDLSALDDDALAVLLAEVDAEFDRLNDEGSTDIPAMTGLADAHDAILAEQDGREASAAELAAQVAELQARIHPPAEPEAEAPAEEEEEAPAEVAVEEEVEERELVTAAARPPRAPNVRPAARAINNRAPSAPVPGRTANVVITAAADVPGLATSQRINTLQVAQAFHDKARNLNNGSPAVCVARVEVPQQVMLGEDPMANARMLDQLIGNPDPASLVAAGGWCAPSVPLFTMFDIGDAGGLVDLPTMGSVRGGVLVPSFYGYGDVAGALWTWTNANDIAAVSGGTITNKALTTNVATLTTATNHGMAVGDVVNVSGVDTTFDGQYTITAVTANTFSYAKTAANVTSIASGGQWANQTPDFTKPCLRIPCPTWVECVPEAEGLCVTHGNLSNRAFPELTRAFVNVVMMAHLHRVSASKIAKITAGATVVTPGAAMIDSDAAGDVLGIVELQAQDMRSQYRAAPTRAVDIFFPEWALGVLRANMAKRAGCCALDITDAQITSWLTMRGIRPQFLSDYQPLYNAAPATAYPANMELTAFFSGAYIVVDGGTIDLGVQRDSALNKTNDFTAAWSEQFFCVARTGPVARKFSVPLTYNGVTGGP